MSATNPDVVGALRRTLKERDRLRKENRRLRTGATEPIAIVGMACRYPGGVASPEGLWSLVAEGRDGISGFPSDRGWDLERLYHSDPDNPGTSYAREGGFLDDVSGFDAEFFGIGPREALAMDPQQRLLLEACWEALEDAGVDPASLGGTPTGVFAGLMYQDYGTGLSHFPAEVEGYVGTGMSGSVVSGRIAYALGLEGPTMTVDTACSSSLVTLHLATQALRGGECEMALAGGVTVISTPRVFTEFSRQRGLAPDGRSKSFAEAADGVAWSEGVGMLVLERLSDAQRNGHPVLAVLRGSAVNQDGASNGLTAPNGPSQQRVIRQALANAGLEPRDVDAVEAHGTGTTLGDPIEAQALLATYGKERENGPLKLGSIKSNIGHTQAAAGVAGVIKMAMAMREGALPKTLHVDAPSSHVDWDAGEVELLTEQVPWEPNGKPRRAGVSSFGISGTNAHVILEEAPASQPAEEGEDDPAGTGVSSEEGGLLPGPVPVPLSAKSEPALREAASRLASHIEANPELDPTDLAYSLATAKSAFPHRAVLLSSDRQELLGDLRAISSGSPSPSVHLGQAKSGRLAFLFTGQGSQRAAMGSELYESTPAFAEAFDLACEALSEALGEPLKEIVFATGKEAEAKLGDTTYAQPALFALEVALFRTLEAAGLRPDLLAGHSIGEIAAAHLAGVFSLKDAAKLVIARGRLMGALPTGGAMLAVQATEQEAAEAIEGKEQDLSIAAINSPDSLVLSGKEEAIAELEAHWQGKERKTKRLAVSHAFHSPLMEPMLEQFATVAKSLEYNEPKIPIVSNLSGELLSKEQATDPAYWVSHVRQPVRFADAVATLKEQGASALIEIGPDPALTPMAQACLEHLDPGERPAAIATLRDQRPEALALGAAIAKAHAAGIALDWKALFQGTGAKRAPLPTYPFQRERFWLEAGIASSDPSAIGQAPAEHPLLGAVIEDPQGEGLTLTGRISLATHPWLKDHAVAGNVLLPGAAFAELALSAGERAGAAHVEELTLAAPLVIDEQGAVQLQVSVSAPGEDGSRQVTVHSRPEGGEETGESQWTQHATGTLARQAQSPAQPLSSWPPQGAEQIDLADFYERLADVGLEYGPAFQGLTAAYRDGDEIYAEVSLAPEQRDQAASFSIHPALLDAALHAAALLAGEELSLRLPFAWSGVSLQAKGATGLRVKLSPKGEDSLCLGLFDPTGSAIASVESLLTRPVSPEQLSGATRPSQPLHEIGWSEVELEGKEPQAIAELTEKGIEAIEAMQSLPELLFYRPALQGELPASAQAATKEALETIQAFLASGRLSESKLALITEGAIATSTEESPDLTLAPLWGLLRSAQTEHPGRFALIDSDGSDASLAALPLAAAQSQEPQLALREGVALAPRVAPALGMPAEQSAAFDPNKTILITGGTGAMAAQVARHLVSEHGAKHLLLISRSGAKAKGAKELKAELTEMGAKVKVAACDVSDPKALKELLDKVPKAHPLGAVIHTAGALQDATLETLDPQSIERVFAPKADAAHHLHELTRDTELDSFTIFSSAAGALGSPGQANYAAANAFCDALAAKRRADGLPATSIAWGVWVQESGLTSGLQEADLARMRRGGMEPLTDRQGLELFDAALACDRPLTLAAGLNRQGLRRMASAGVLPAVLSGLVQTPARRQRAASGELAAKLAALPEAERGAYVLELVRAEVAAVLGHGSAASIDPGKAFQEMGFDSLAAVELRNSLTALSGLSMPATAVFDYPTPEALADYLLGEATASGASKHVAVRAQASDEPIAILGMACRYPGGVTSPGDLWDLVAEGRDGISEFPADRGWDLERLYDPDPDNPGTSYAREGGFLHDAPEFDAEFFGIGPREAVAMDPQQRLLLEACWEALEDAGVDPGSLGGTPTGVFSGVMYQDYGMRLQGLPAELEGYVGTGMSGSVVSGRIAYTLGLEGPAMTVDTACSSSLVTIHLAAQALRQGECEMALAGGVTVLATPGAFLEFSRQRGLAPDGRSKSFAEAADGAGFSEGVGMLVLQRLSDAQRNGHPVLAVIKGSAVNQDGASNGLTAPNGPSQQRVIRQALANAGLEPKDVDAVEAHGTGTTLGDPIEAGALLATYGQEREEPLRLGSLKSNIGHTQAAAGVGGVIKMAMALREGALPKTLHVDEPSSKVDWEAGQVELLTEQVPWEPNGKPRRAGVSSFGISGTNAHVILEEAPAPKPAEEPEPAEQPLGIPVPLPLSAKSESALREAAGRLTSHLKASPELGPIDLAYSLATTRSAFSHRAVLLSKERKELLSDLEELAKGKGNPTSASADARPVFLFAGQGAQHLQMAHELCRSVPTFARHIDACEQALSPFVDWSLTEVLGDPEGKWLDRFDIIQPALFAVMVGLARLWEACGVRPSLLAGHSQGEIAAAHVSGALSLGDAARVVAKRGQALAKIAGKGATASVSLSAEDLEERLAPYGERLSVAAINGPASTVASGEPKAIEELLEECEADRVRAQRVDINCAAHSHQIEALKEELEEAFDPIEPRKAQIPLHSTVSGEQIDGTELGPEHWYRNLRQTVQFEPVISAMLKEGRRCFVEIAPHPVLSFGAQECADALQVKDAHILATLRREEQGPKRFAISLAEAHAAGVALDWEALFKGTGAKRVALPTYPFQRERFWLERGIASSDPSAIGQAAVEHPLLAAVIEDPQGEGLTLTGRISLQTHPWLKDHAVAGNVLLPGTAFAELALSAGQRAGAGHLEELTLTAPLVLSEQGAAQLQVSVSAPGQEGSRQVSIHSRQEQGGEEEEGSQWTQHASGTLSSQPPKAQGPLQSWPPQGATQIDLAGFYEGLADIGVEYGPAFQGLGAAYREGANVYAEVSLAPEQRDQAGVFAIHPALLDAALHAALLAFGEEQSLRLPFAWSGVSVGARGATELRVKLSQSGEDSVSLELFDQAGIALASVESLITRPVSPEQLAGATRSSQPLHEIGWSEVELEGKEPDSIAEPRTGEDVEAIGESVPPELLLYRPAPQGELPASAQAATKEALETIQALLASERLSGSKLALITEGAIATSTEESPDLTLAPLWGLLRSAQAEHPGRFALIDTDGSEASLAAVSLAAAQNVEPQIALREGKALAPRVAPAKDDGDSLLPPPGPYRLESSGSGSLEGLSLAPNPRATGPLGPSEVRIELRAAGLNFRDVLIALGLYPGKGTIGGEGAGIVVEVGPEVEGLAAGDRVMGLVPDSFGPLAVSDERTLVRMPESFTFEQAAAIPVVFVTAFMGFFDLADLKAGERVLIHAGAGGVGMAAIGLAKRAGAEVFATASPSKWDTLRELGIEEDHIASSRDLGFKEKFLQATGGEGVDVVLNSLAKDYVDASLDLLPRGGRFLEMGKTDIRDAEEIAAKHPGVSYRAYDLIEAGPERMGEMLREVISLFEAAELEHSPITTWDLRSAPQAFRHLREGRNTGKVVLTVPRPVDPEKTVLITGGTGAMAAQVARHLVSEHGAKHLLLISRSGAKAKGAKELKAELTEMGAKVKVAACDVSDPKALKELLDKVPKAHPLGAVIHTAGALQDATLETLDPQSIERVFAPKADAAHHLHELTRDTELDSFTIFSSAAGALGSPGQANYAAANAFCDALAAKRRAEGLPATSIAWGVWVQESGLTSGLQEADLARMRRGGMEPLTDRQGLELFDAALACDRPLTLAAGLNRQGLRTMASAGVLPPLLSGLVQSPARRQRAASGELATKLAALPEAEREGYVQELVASETAAVLGHGSAATIDPKKAFQEMGFDSLAAVELKNRLATATGVNVPATAVFDYPNPAALASYLLGEATTGGASRRVAVRAQATDEPIAILGMACRYPGGVSSPADLWDLVTEGRDAIAEFPTDRGWDLERLYDPDPDNPGTSYAKEGGFIDEATVFDAEFFAISPREAEAMDPQQRLLLEAAWEALEDAGIDPTGLGGTPTGVFAGMSSQDYQFIAANNRDFDGYGVTGGVSSVASGRIAYSLGLEGPAMTVDTACSSSLVTMHLAAQALRAGECSLAMAGGVTVLATPGAFVGFSRGRGLAPDGRSKSFAEAADGAGFSEGIGMLVLARLSDAQREGHPILAVLRGSAVNQDGASNGLAAPNGPSQERVILQALANAGLESKDVDAVEAHGTGTALGDPIEAGALLATYGQDREEPLRLGSLKSNIGHAQAAAGVAGVIKMTMALREGALPKTLHVDTPSSKVDWEAGKIELLTEQRPWESNGRPRRAGVSSFGVSGTNAHVILEEAPSVSETGEGPEEKQAPAADSDRTPLPGPTPFLLSAKSEPALKGQATRLASHLERNPKLDLNDLAYSLATTRASFDHRAVAFGADREQLISSLTAFARGDEASAVVQGVAQGEQRPAFLFPGQGGQWHGMAVELLESSPAFARHMDACEQALSPFVDWSLGEVLRGVDGAPTLDKAEVLQPVLFAVMVSLAKLWREFGVEPRAVVGHSQGEVAAAHVAGGLSLEEAARVVTLRIRTIVKGAGAGRMVAVRAPAKMVEARIKPWAGRIDIGVINGPTLTALSGANDAIDEFLEACAEEGIRVREIPGAYGASHSSQAEEFRDELLEVLALVSPQSGDVPFYSTVTGDLFDTAKVDAEYWYRNVRNTVQFEATVRSLIEGGCRSFLEIGPHPVLGFGVRETAEATESAHGSATVLGTLRRDEGGPQRFAVSLAEAHVTGVPVDWGVMFRGSGAKRVPLPTYSFQRKRYWIDATAIGTGDLTAAGQASAEHPLLGATVAVAGGDERLLTGRISLATHPWLADHAVLDTPLLPGVAFVELALRAGREVGCETLKELTLQAPLILSESNSTQLQVTLGEPGDHGRRNVAIYSRPEVASGDEEGEWRCHASGELSPMSGEASAGLDSWPPADADPIEIDSLYENLAERGVEYGPAFQGLQAAWRRGNEIFAEVSLAPEQARDAASFGLHPALFDAAFHAAVGLALDAEEAAAATGDGEKQATLWLPFSWQGVQITATGTDSLRVCLLPGDNTLSVRAFDQAGLPVAQVDSLIARPIEEGQLKRAGQLPLHRLKWSPLEERVSDDRELRLAILGDAKISPVTAELFPDLETLVETLDGAAPPDAVLCEIPPAERADGGVIDAYHAVNRRVLVLLQAWLADERLTNTRLVFVTHGAVPAVAEEVPDLSSASLAGLLRSAELEHPGRFALIDLDQTAESRAALPEAIKRSDEPQLALRKGKALVPRLGREPIGGARGEGGQPVVDPNATVLITGGTSGIGAQVARHLAAAHGARHLLLASRSGGDADGTAGLTAELEALGAEVTIASCDVSDRDALEALLASIPTEHPLGAVVHSAGWLVDGTIESLSPEDFGQVFAPKADAAWHLHELTEGIDLSAFVVFSSVAGTVGSPGQANYAAASTFLDALAAHRHANGLPATAIAWGLWVQEGSATSRMADADQARIRRSGIEGLSDEQGLELFDAALAGDAPHALAIRFNLPRLRTLARAGFAPPVLRGLIRIPARRGSTGSLSAKLATLPEGEREAHVLQLVRGEIATVLGHESAEEVEPGRSFTDMGFDSLSAVELRNRLEGATGLDLPATLAFDYTTPAALAGYLQAEALAKGGTSSGPLPDDPFALPGDESDTSGAAIGSLLNQARGQGKALEYVELLRAVSQFRPSFEGRVDPADAPAPVSLAEGSAGTSLICLASATPQSGAHEYTSFAKEFDGRRNVLAVPQSGFAPGERVPADLSAAVETHVGSIRGLTGDDPFILVGHSTGGLYAHAVASHLEREGVTPEALVLIDTYRTDQLVGAGIFEPLMMKLIGEDGEGEAVSITRLTAMGAHLRALQDWTYEEISAPILLVRCGELPSGISADSEWRAPSWNLGNEIEVPGDHFSMMQKHVGSTARAVEDWLAGAAGGSSAADTEKGRAAGERSKSDRS